jgi:FtsH-binding integral membrane protein
MGLAAVTLTSLSLAFGIAIARNPATGLPGAVKEALVWGLVLTFVLTVVTAGYMASTPGHHVGTPTTGARLALMGWSREVGDLRVAHFFATHALHGVPLAGLAALALPGALQRPAVRLAALAYAALVVALFWQALQGRPFL